MMESHCCLKKSKFEKQNCITKFCIFRKENDTNMSIEGQQNKFKMILIPPKEIETKQIEAKRFKKKNFLEEEIDDSDTWKQNLKFCQREYGRYHDKTTDCMMNLGHSYMRKKSYEEALSIFKKVVRIRRSMKGDEDLSVGLALDCVGRAAVFMEELDWGLIALYEAFNIRFNALGPWNIDVADTLNNIAGALYRINELILAEEAYTEVMSVRKAVWGKNHPSVAVTACSLGRTQLRRSNLEGALSSFHEALRIYRVALNLPDSSITIQKVLKKIVRTERLMISLGTEYGYC